MDKMSQKVPFHAARIEWLDERRTYLALARSRQRNTAANGHTDVNVMTSTRRQGQELFDRESRLLPGISGEDFLRKWEAKEYDQVTDTDLARRVNRLLLMLPFASPIES